MSVTVVEKLTGLYPSFTWQDIEAGDGTTSVVVIAGALLSAAERLFEAQRDGWSKQKKARVFLLASQETQYHPPWNHFWIIKIIQFMPLLANNITVFPSQSPAGWFDLFDCLCHFVLLWIGVGVDVLLRLKKGIHPQTITEARHQHISCTPQQKNSSEANKVWSERNRITGYGDSSLVFCKIEAKT